MLQDVRRVEESVFLECYLALKVCKVEHVCEVYVEDARLSARMRRMC